jgi:hypothetical protein
MLALGLPQPKATPDAILPNETILPNDYLCFGDNITRLASLAEILCGRKHISATSAANMAVHEVLRL